MSEKPANLFPQSREARTVFGRLDQNAKALGRRGPKRCRTLEQRDKLEAACGELARRGVFAEALDATLENGITDLRGVTNALAWKADNGWRPRGGNGGGVHKAAFIRSTPSAEQMAEDRRLLDEHRQQRAQATAG